MRYIVYSLVTMLMSVSTLSAQLTLEEYCQQVVDYSRTLHRAEDAVEASEADMRLAHKDYLPSLTMDRDFTLNFRDRGDERQWGWSMRADIRQPIYTGGAVRAAAKQSELKYEMAIDNMRSSILEVQYAAEYAYWTLSRAEIYRRAIADYVTIIGSLRDVVSRRFDEGYTSKSDLLQVESRMSDAEYQSSAAEQEYLVALHNFNLLRGADAMVEVVLARTLTDSEPMPERESVANIVARHPDYLSSVRDEEYARWGIRAASSRYMPSIYAGVFGLWQPKSPNIKGAGTMLDGGIMLTTSVPIFHFGARRQAMRSARSVWSSAQWATSEMYDSITLDESNGWTNIVTTYSRMESTRRNLQLAAENLEISTYSYHEGMTTILDVLQAQISWLQIYTNAITAQFDYAVAVAAYKLVTAAMY